MNTAPNKQDIFILEKKYWAAMKNNDVEAAVSLTRFPCIVTSPKGAMRVNESQYRQMMQANNNGQYQDIVIKDPQVDLLNEDTALISYSIMHKGMKMLDVSTWVRDGEKWVCAFHSENPIQ
ncbi:hypothetical protein CIK05_01090 [Bdellovibrio sp. qaytius]|nr:hypothetical protein CIK05_01090 [Bdellovibrio sp. qaytius]